MVAAAGGPIYTSLAVSAGRPSAHLAVAAGERNIKQPLTLVWLVQAVAQVPNMAVAAGWRQKAVISEPILVYMHVPKKTIFLAKYPAK